MYGEIIQVDCLFLSVGYNVPEQAAVVIQGREKGEAFSSLVLNVAPTEKADRLLQRQLGFTSSRAANNLITAIKSDGPGRCCRECSSSFHSLFS